MINPWRQRAFRKAQATLNHPKMAEKSSQTLFFKRILKIDDSDQKIYLQLFFADWFKFYGELIERPFFAEVSVLIK
jgi:hypothetical protein